GLARHQEPEQTTSLVDSPTQLLEHDPKGNMLTILAYAGTKALPDENPRVTTGSLLALGNGRPAGPITPPIPGAEEGEEDEEEKRRRAALLGVGPLFLSALVEQQPGGHIPMIQGTPHLALVPTVSSKPQLQGGATGAPNPPVASGAPAPSPASFRPGPA